MKIKEYGEIYFDGTTITLRGWSFQLDNKDRLNGKNMKQLLKTIFNEIAKNENISWIFINNRIL